VSTDNVARYNTAANTGRYTKAFAEKRGGKKGRKRKGYGMARE
jgi:hypothetical protein